MKRLLPGTIIRQIADPERLYLVTATSGWGFEVKGYTWIPWDKADGWEAFTVVNFICSNEWRRL